MIGFVSIVRRLIEWIWRIYKVAIVKNAKGWIKLFLILSMSRFNKKKYKLRTRSSRIKIEMIKLFINQNFQELEKLINADIAADLQ